MNVFTTFKQKLKKNHRSNCALIVNFKDIIKFQYNKKHVKYIHQKHFISWAPVTSVSKGVLNIFHVKLNDHDIQKSFINIFTICFYCRSTKCV